jgi:hypothetical protein
MIIAGTRITTRSGHQLLADHLWRGDGNSDVRTLRGDEADLHDMVAFARHAGQRYALRHYHLSPGEPTTQAEGLDIIARIGAEFGFDPNTAVVVQHRKERRVEYDLMTGTQGYEFHWHAIVPEVDPISLKVLDSRKMFGRHERLAREAELRLLHRVIKGRHNCSVIAALEARGDHLAAGRLREAGIEEGPPAYAAYTSRQRRALERTHADHRGEPLDLPTLVRNLNLIWAKHAPDPPALAEALRGAGLRLRHPADPPAGSIEGRVIAPAPTTHGTTWVVDAWDSQRQEAYVLGAAYRLLREPRSRVEEVLRPRRPPPQHVPVPPPPLPPAGPAGHTQEQYPGQVGRLGSN